jgi:hypothetical protein
MCCSRRPRREVRRDGPAESLRGCSRVPMEGAYARQGRCRAAPAGPSLHNADRRIRLRSRRSAPSGSRRAATGVRNNRRVCSETVEDHDRRFWYRWPLTWRSSHAFTVLNTTQFHVRRLGTDLARRKPGVQIPSPPPHNSPGHRPGGSLPPGRGRSSTALRAVDDQHRAQGRCPRLVQSAASSSGISGCGERRHRFGSRASVAL